jgi:hypothetical protein
MGSQMKFAMGALSVVTALVAYAIYIVQTAKRGGIEPHPFSWFLWTATTAVAYWVQKRSGAGPGIWVTLVTTVICLLIAILSLYRSKGSFPAIDWGWLFLGLFVLVAYLGMKSAAYSVTIATAADLAGYGPTVRKGWTEPHKDGARSFFLNSLKFFFSLFALSTYSFETLLFPAALTTANAGVAIMLLLRRKQIRAKKGSVRYTSD